MWICSKCADFNFASNAGADGINYDSDKRFSVLLVECLCRAVNTRHPAAITRMTVIP